MRKSRKIEKVVEKVLHQHLAVKPFEKLTIVSDDKKMKIAKHFFSYAKRIAIDVSWFMMEVRKEDGEEPPEQIKAGMLASDVIIAITSKSLTHAKSTIEAVSKGARVASMPGIEEEMLTKGAMTASFESIKETTQNLMRNLEGSNFVEVKSSNGTNLFFSVRGREWYVDDGDLREPGKIGNLPCGEVFIAPNENSVNGKIVFDYFPGVKGKLKLDVESGKIVKTNKKLKLIEGFENKKMIGEFGIGANPKAKIIGNVLEDEKVLGTVHIALGRNIGFGGTLDLPFHVDGIIKKPTLKVDNRTIIKSGKLVI